SHGARRTTWEPASAGSIRLKADFTELLSSSIVPEPRDVDFAFVVRQRKRLGGPLRCQILSRIAICPVAFDDQRFDSGNPVAAAASLITCCSSVAREHAPIADAVSITTERTLSFMVVPY